MVDWLIVTFNHTHILSVVLMGLVQSRVVVECANGEQYDGYQMIWLFTGSSIHVEYNSITDGR